MHKQSQINMELMLDKYDLRGSKKIADVGGRNVNNEGTYRHLFLSDDCEYHGIDIEEANGVSIVMTQPYKIPCPDNSYDLVISGQTLEHCEFFWMLFLEMVRITKSGGHIVAIAPSDGRQHRYPVDCWRFYNDGFVALGKWAKIEVIETYTDKKKENKWKDQVGVYRKPKRWTKSLALGAIGLSET